MNIPSRSASQKQHDLPGDRTQLGWQIIQPAPFQLTVLSGARLEHILVGKHPVHQFPAAQNWVKEYGDRRRLANALQPSLLNELPPDHFGGRNARLSAAGWGELQQAL